MPQETINLILSILLPAAVTTIGFIVRDWWRKRKNTIQYGDDLVEAMNKTAASLKQARAEIGELDQALRTQDETHQHELDDLQFQHKRERARLRERLDQLEKVLRSYDISFTLTTHPDIKVTDVKVVGKEDVMQSQKMQAIREERRTQDRKDQENKPKT